MSDELNMPIEEQVAYTDDNIRHLSDMEHVRLRPGMYIGKLGDGSQNDDGIYVLMKEVVDNSIDEFKMNAGKRIEIDITDHKRVSVRDYGRGIPQGKLIDSVSILNTRGKFDSKAFKKSINKDLDPSCKIDGVIITNQSGFAALDEEEDADGRPVLKENPMHATEKMFQSLPIYVVPDAQLPNIDDTHFPMIYGSTKAGATFVEHEALEFAISEHFFFNKNQNCLRVIEGFDVMEGDTSAYIYGSFSATPAATPAAT